MPTLDAAHGRSVARNATRPGAFARISILDVGQGDAILIEGSHGGRLLIDGGPDPNRLLVALDRRIPPWDRRIDAVILSHPHEDHVAGLASLLQRYHVDRVFEPGMRGPGPGYAAWVRELAAPGAPVRLSIAAGDRLAVDEIGMRVLWPISGQVPVIPPDGGTGINNVSVVLLGHVGARQFLLMGDVEQDIDPSLLADHLPRVDLLKVAHHGSRTATTQAFVDTVRPGVAVASAGAGNPYGHPAATTMARLAASGARVLRTDRDGTVVVGFEAGSMTVRTEGGRATGDVTPPGRTMSASNLGSAANRAPRFLCAIPVTALVVEPTSPTLTGPPATASVRPPTAIAVDPDDRSRPPRVPPTLPPAPSSAGMVRVGRGRATRRRPGRRGHVEGRVPSGR